MVELYFLRILNTNLSGMKTSIFAEGRFTASTSRIEGVKGVGISNGHYFLIFMVQQLTKAPLTPEHVFDRHLVFRRHVLVSYEVATKYFSV